MIRKYTDYVGRVIWGKLIAYYDDWCIVKKDIAPIFNRIHMIDELVSIEYNEFLEDNISGV